MSRKLAFATSHAYLPEEQRADRQTDREGERERERERERGGEAGWRGGWRAGAGEGKKESDNETTAAAVEDSRRFEALRNKVCSTGPRCSTYNDACIMRDELLLLLALAYAGQCESTFSSVPIVSH